MFQGKNGLSQFTLYFIFFIDLMGYAIVLPIFAPLFLSPSDSWLLATASFEWRCLFFGLVLTIYAVAQWLGTPIFASLAQAKGAKKILSVALFGNAVAYVLTGFGLLHQNLVLIVIGRFLGGFTTGNSSLAASSFFLQPTIISSVRSRPWALIAGGLGFCVGPLLAGILADESVLGVFHNALPFWVMAGLVMLNLLLVTISLVDVSSPAARSMPLSESLSRRFSTLAQSLRRLDCIALILFLLGWFLFIQFLSVYLLLQFAFTEAMIGFAFCFLGIIWTLTIFAFSRFKPFFEAQAQRLFRISLFGSAFFCFTVLWPIRWPIFALLIALLIIFLSFVWTHLGAFFFETISSEDDAELNRLFSSSSAFAAVAANMVGGLLLLLSYQFFFIAAGICILASGFLFLWNSMRMKHA